MNHIIKKGARYTKALQLKMNRGRIFKEIMEMIPVITVDAAENITLVNFKISIKLAGFSYNGSISIFSAK